MIENCIERESKQETARERETMSICEMVKPQKQYYHCNMKSAYYHIDRRLYREREQEREREREREQERERLCPSVKW